MRLIFRKGKTVCMPSHKILGISAEMFANLNGVECNNCIELHGLVFQILCPIYTQYNSPFHAFIHRFDNHFKTPLHQSLTF